MAFLSEVALAAIGFKEIGSNVLISDRASIHGAQNIRIGSNVRIDDFCIISAGENEFIIGNHVHVAVAVTLIGHATIELMDFSGISGRTSIYSSSDDFSGNVLTGPTVPDEFKNVDSRPVRVGRHVVVGAGSVILPGTELADGCTVGALSMVRGQWEPFTFLAGSPAKKRGERARGLLKMEQRFKDYTSGTDR
jgi:dTDP-4-amino-4,6-dideoxy-D-glucose acyltransferase